METVEGISQQKETAQRALSAIAGKGTLPPILTQLDPDISRRLFRAYPPVSSAPVHSPPCFTLNLEPVPSQSIGRSGGSDERQELLCHLLVLG